MPHWTLNFQQVPSSGVVPGTPCSQWRYRYTFLIPIVLDDIWGLGVSKFSAKWTLEVLDLNGGVVWRQHVELSGWAASGFGGLVGYYFLPNQASFLVQTTDQAGQTTEERGNAVKAIYETLEESPTWGLGLEVGMWGCWTSWIEPQALPAASHFHVVFHTAGMVGLRSPYAPLQVATQQPSTCAAMLDAPGFHRIIRPADGVLAQAFAGRTRTYLTRRVAQALQEPQVAKLPDNTLLVAGKFGEVDWRLLRSWDDGLTWEEGYAVLWSADYTDMRMAVAQDGAVVTIARRGGTLYCRHSRDEYVSTSSLGPAAAPCELSLHAASGRLLVTDGVSLLYESWDSGQTWTAQQGAL